MKDLFLAIALAITFLASGLAEAATGYVCQFRRVPGSGSLGTSGHVYVTFNSAPNCTGTLQNARSYCSANATSSSCAASSVFQYTAADLNNLMQLLQNAATAGTKVEHLDATCNSAGATCGGHLTFWGAP